MPRYGCGESIGDADVIVINKTPISKETMDKCPNLKAIAVLATGYNVVDYEYAKAKGIPVMKVEKAAMDRIAPGQAHQGVAAITTIPYTTASGQAMLTGATGIIR